MKKLICLFVLITFLVGVNYAFSAKLQRDEDTGIAIQGALYPHGNQSWTISTTRTRTDYSTASIVRMVSDAAFYFKIGDSTVNAFTTDGHYVPANTIEYFLMRANNYISVLGVTEGTFHVSEME